MAGEPSRPRKRGRPKLFNTADQKKKRLLRCRKYRSNLVNIGNAHEKWEALREKYSWTHAEMASHLVDSFLKYDCDSSTSSDPSKSRTLTPVYASSTSSSSSPTIASPQSSDYAPSPPQYREQSVNIPWSRSSQAEDPMASRSLRVGFRRKSTHEDDRMKNGEEDDAPSSSINHDPSDTDSVELDINYEHSIILDNADMKSEPIDVKLEPIYQFSTEEVPDSDSTELETKDEHHTKNTTSHSCDIKLEPIYQLSTKEVPDRDSTELETKEERHTNNTTSHSCDIKLEPFDNVNTKEEPPDNDTELKSNDEHHTNNTTSHSCDTMLEPTDSFTVKLEPPNS